MRNRQADYYRWRRKHRENWNEIKRRNYQKGALWQQNAGQIWTAEEDAMILDPNRPFDRELAKQLGRTILAIQAERHCLKVRSKKRNQSKA
jgi:hypothetical protein